jgi:hypothetical protein
MKKYALNLLALALVVVGSGCFTAHQATPKSILKIAGVEIQNPKDAELQNLVVTKFKTNGVEFVQIQIGAYKSTMNPEVVKESTTGTAAMINAGADAGVKYFTLGLQTAARAAGVPQLPQGPPAPK